MTITVGVAVLAACARPAEPDVVAFVEGESVRYQAFSEYVEANVGRRAEALNSDVLEVLFDEFLDEIIARRIAAREVPAGTPRERNFEVWVDGLTVEPPSTDELFRRFRSDAQDLSRPPRVVLRQIVTETFEQAHGARQEILDGAEFGEVADRFSQHEFAPAGGLQGVFSEDDLPQNIAEQVFALPEHTVSLIVEMDFGFALYQVDEILSAEEVEFNGVRETLEQQILSERRQQQLVQRVESHRTRDNVTIYPRNLPFDYRGAYKDLVNEIN